MARPRVNLHAVLLGLTGNVYFQPPDNVAMEYPCIVYKRDRADTRFADGIPFIFTKRYMVTVIDRNPDSDIVDQVCMLPRCKHDRFFTKNNLNHDVFVLYF